MGLAAGSRENITDIVSSNNVFPVLSGCLIEVGMMDEAESRHLLQQKFEADDLDPGDLSSLPSRLEHLPLALVQAAAFIQEMSISVDEYLRLLEKSDQQLMDLLSEEFETDGRPLRGKW